MKKVKWIFRFVLSLNILCGVLLAFSVLSPEIDPVKWWLPSIAGLAFLEIFIANVFFFVFWLFAKNKYALISLSFIVFGLPEIPNHIQFNLDEAAKSRETRVLSLNVRNFDLYNWSENRKTRDRILEAIKQEDADIICLQEFFNSTNPKQNFKTLDTILMFDRHYYSHVEYTAILKKTEHWGISTFSAYPIIRRGKIRFEAGSHNICIYSDLLVNRDTVRVYNVHLASLKFGKQDYHYLEGVVDHMDQDVKGSRNLIRKIKSAYEMRSLQSRKVKASMDASPYPVILCGDFNDTPTSYTYNLISNGMNDSFKIKGTGLGATYNGKLPFLRIDYVLADPQFTILKHRVIENDLSDHYPICASLELLP